MQQHSKRHSKTCKKKNTTCRFNFPRPVSAKTFICRGKSNADIQKTCKCNVPSTTVVTPCACVHNEALKMKKDVAEKMMGDIKKALTDETISYGTVEHLFDSLGISQHLKLHMNGLVKRHMF